MGLSAWGVQLDFAAGVHRRGRARLVVRPAQGTWALVVRSTKRQRRLCARAGTCPPSVGTIAGSLYARRRDDATWHREWCVHCARCGALLFDARAVEEDG